MATFEKYVTFLVNDILFGVSVTKVQEVLRSQEITDVPLSSTAVPGVINLRGQIIPAMDLRRRLGLAGNKDKKELMNVVLRTNKGSVSLLVDEIGDVKNFSSDSYEDPPATFGETIRHVTTRVCKLEDRLLLVLDTEKVTQFSESKGHTEAR
jgi:purine-binding chemotaxis protein CheW